MNANTKVDAQVAGCADVTLDHRLLDRNRASHRLNDASELDENSIAGALEHMSVLAGDGGIDEFRAQCPQSRERAILVCASHPAEANDVGSQDRGDLADLGHYTPHAHGALTQRPTGPVAAMGRAMPSDPRSANFRYSQRIAQSSRSALGQLGSHAAKKRALRFSSEEQLRTIRLMYHL